MMIARLAHAHAGGLVDVRVGGGGAYAVTEALPWEVSRSDIASS